MNGNCMVNHFNHSEHMGSDAAHCRDEAKPPGGCNPVIKISTSNLFRYPLGSNDSVLQIDSLQHGFVFVKQY
jgi:hypothetical protein